MKIKMIHIVNFAGLKNLTINFKEGFNLIYGVNESGKSSIENFIKIWLYGIQRDENGEIDRKKYMPLNKRVFLVNWYWIIMVGES